MIGTGSLLMTQILEAVKENETMYGYIRGNELVLDGYIPVTAEQRKALIDAGLGEL